jgi:hypothetical protein
MSWNLGIEKRQLTALLRGSHHPSKKIVLAVKYLCSSLAQWINSVTTEIAGGGGGGEMGGL